MQSVSKIQSRSNSSSSTLCMLNKSKMCMDIFSKKICRPGIHYSMKMARGDKFLARKVIVSLEHLPFTILTFYLLDVLCRIQENITVYKVSSKNFDLDFDRPKCNWINPVLGFHFIVYVL